MVYRPSKPHRPVVGRDEYSLVISYVETVCWAKYCRQFPEATSSLPPPELWGASLMTGSIHVGKQNNLKVGLLLGKTRNAAVIKLVLVYSFSYH